MYIRPKPPITIEAQLALYAGEQRSPAHGARADTLLARLGKVLLEKTPDLISHDEIPFRTEHRLNGDGTVTTEPLFDKKEYIDMLRQPNSKTVVANLSGMITMYTTLRPEIEKRVFTHKPGPDHPSFVGSGNHNMAFSLALNTDSVTKDAIVIIPKPSADWSDQARLNERAIAIAKTKGLHGFEQGIALSYDPAVLVVKKAAGKPIEELSYLERKLIAPTHKERMLQDILSLRGKGISLDENPDNYFYDPTYGFTVIDLGKSLRGSDDEQTMRSNLATIKYICT